MASRTSIEWTNATWNPVTGCSKVSAGCQNCYAERMALRLNAMGQERYKNKFDVTLHTDLLEIPIKWKKPRMIFVNSMSDLFHEKIPLGFIERVFHTMELANHHIFQILTKRSKRLLELAPFLNWPKNLWMGVSVENQNAVSRIADLEEVPASTRFISFEPLLGPVQNISLGGIHWVIVGGESGPRARPLERHWVYGIKDLCATKGVPFYFKQWGGKRKKLNGRILDGRTYNEYPARC